MQTAAICKAALDSDDFSPTVVYDWPKAMLRLDECQTSKPCCLHATGRPTHTRMYLVPWRALLTCAWPAASFQLSPKSATLATQPLAVRCAPGTPPPAAPRVLPPPAGAADVRRRTFAALARTSSKVERASREGCG
jgi:hypothetical protein